MQCSQCSFENPPGMVFCGKCGAKLALPCASCGFVNPEEFAFCGKCGSPLTVGAAGLGFQPALKFASPQVYTPKHLAEKILTSKSALEGERKQVTVLFADMKGSMELLADRDPEEARKLLDPVIEHMMEAVHRYEGTVSNLMGDGIMALFGAPLAHEDHAVRACYAALRMQESVKRYADGLRRTEGIPIQIRVGLNSGEVVVGAIGNDLKMDYTAIGQTVHLASRMEQMAKPGSILMTADTLRLTEGYVQVNSLGPAAVKGMSDPVEVLEVTGTGAARTRFQATASRGLTRFVGRDAETEQLRKALEQARGGHGQIVAVVGEPGVGKSRLFYEFIHSNWTDGCLIVESGSLAHGKATPYLSVIDLLKAYCKIQDRDNQREIREKITGKLLTLDEALRSSLPALLALLDVAVEDNAWDGLDPGERRRRTLEAVKRLLLRESQVQPLLVVFEDLHWIDSETQAFLDSFIDGLPNALLLLLVNYRPEYQHGWGGKAYYRQLRIDPLPPESAEELLLEALGDDASLQPLKRRLIERTEGNPFFLEECVRELVESKFLLGKRGNYWLEKTVDSAHMPATVQAVLGARIDRLPLEAKQLLQFASVIGKDFSFALLHAVVDLSEEELHRELGHLQSAEFIYEMSFFPELNYTFKHALTHEVAYQSLLRARRQPCHERIALALESRFHDIAEAQPQLLAHHYTEAGLGARAIPYWQRAGEKANERAAHAEAISYLNNGLELLKTVPNSAESLQQELALYAALGRSLKDSKGYGDPEVERAYTRARELCRRVGEAPQVFSTLLGLSIYFVVRANLQTARELGEQLLDMAQNRHDPVLLVEAHYVLGVTHFWFGEFVPARKHLEQAVAHYDPLRHDSHIMLFGQNEGVVCLSRSALNLWYLGYPDQALARVNEALTKARELSHAASLAYVLYWTAFIYHLRRDLQKTEHWTEASLALSGEHGFGFWPPQGMILQGWVLTEEGQTLDGIARMRQGLAALDAAGTKILRAYFLGLVADAESQAGRVGEGLAMLSEALTVVEETKGGWAAAELHRLKGELLRQKAKGSGQTAITEAEAESCFCQAIEVSRRQSAKSLELRAAMSLSRLWRGQGKGEQAGQLLSDIYGWFTEGFDTADLKEAKSLLEELS